jgi:hypothetical protein
MVTRAAILVLALGACIGQTPEDKERNGVVSVGRKGPTHNPGSPCLLCHDFTLAGTIYLHASDTSGVAGVRITMTDATGHLFGAVSNATGNFFVTENIVFPVNVEISNGTSTKKMRNHIGQWGSCAECHSPPAGATSNGRIFVEDP